MRFQAILESGIFRLVLAVLLIVGIFGGIFLFASFPREKNCVQSIENPSENRCFNTMQEALSYLSNGEIVLPPDASQEEIQAALEQYYSEKATEEAESD